jgi:hypothetical protein
MDARQSGIHDRVSPLSSGGAFESACPGCRRERHCSRAWKCARTQRLDQRSQRHRQCGQSARDTAAGHPPRARTHLGRSRRYLPNVAGAAISQDETHAVCAIQISPLGYPSGRQGERQAARPQDHKHLQGMLIDIRDAPTAGAGVCVAGGGAALPGLTGEAPHPIGCNPASICARRDSSP